MWQLADSVAFAVSCLDFTLQTTSKVRLIWIINKSWPWIIGVKPQLSFFVHDEYERTKSRITDMRPLGGCATINYVRYSGGLFTAVSTF
jgi:hypothetical protein